MQPAEDGTKKRLGSGPPVVRIVAEEGEEEDGSAMVSISHDGDYATAVCIGYEERK
jgi:holo-[acyl-carrier protein] synthase